MTDFSKLAAQLDAKRIQCPPDICINDYANSLECGGERLLKAPASFSELAQHIKGESFEDSCVNCVEAFLEELKGSQNPDLWNAYAANGGQLALHHPDMGDRGDDDGISHFKVLPPNDGREIDWGIFYNVREKGDGSDLHHELAHWIDDKTYYEVKKGSCEFFDAPPVSGLHSDTVVWSRIQKLDEKLYANCESKAIRKVLDSIGYSDDTTTPEIMGEEIFCEAVARHFGPPPKDKVQSPLIGAYMKKIVALDIAIMKQDVPLEQKFEQRKLLNIGLNQPFRRYFNEDKVKTLLAEHKGASKATKRSYEEAIEQYISDGLDAVVQDISASIAVTVPKAPSGRERK